MRFCEVKTTEKEFFNNMKEMAMGPSKFLETRNEADNLWLEAKPDCGFKVLGGSLDFAPPAAAASKDGEWLEQICFPWAIAKDGVIAIVVKRQKEYFPFFLGVKYQAGQAKAVLGKLWLPPVSRFGAIDIFDDGFCALRVESQAGDILSTQPGTAVIHYIADGNLLCRYLMGLVDEADLFSAEKTPPEAPYRRLIITLPAGRLDAEYIKSQEPPAEGRKALKAQLAERDKQVAEFQAEAERQESDAAKREALIAALQTELEARQESAARDGREIKGTQAELESLRQALAEREKQIAELTAALEAARQDLKKERDRTRKVLNEKADSHKEDMDYAIELGKAVESWKKLAAELKEAIGRSWFFKNRPDVQGILDSFPKETEF
ncbi:MAG: hypothetical protein A3H67_02870 [Candidatus Buchananbacteria bacterium RIFCSPLOWO2_02_FULL_46_11b]|uniref:Uncharacterized protein n=2 Tax=Candidatus Buchananiibacteriota TaxID=1817903 RepID=A0A1G1YNY1_9BACT|nr:MAG: hypothetical protein A3B15_02400 [Candidatus Buchananbacteria bacterium RIFCSPLOWO2_01_FULL_45_31]OGY56953.1 MAG: hypothetical protein A3H67_02870 [Candidatus Buchananbacteria bacterium RIFCSPLOWO2_02_FULL_46_11b]